MENETGTRAQRRQAQRAERRQASSPTSPVVDIPNRMRRRSELREAQHEVGKVRAKMGRRNDRWMKRLKTRTKGISGNPQKRFVQLKWYV